MTDLELERLISLTKVIRAMPRGNIPTLDRVATHTVVMVWPPNDVDPLTSQPVIQAEKDAIEAVVVGWDWTLTADRQEHWATLQNAVDVAAERDQVIPRSIIGLMLDEVNTLRTWIREFEGIIASATSLADLKAKVAAISGTMEDRTNAQARTAVKNRMVNGGGIS